MTCRFLTKLCGFLTLTTGLMAADSAERIYLSGKGPSDAVEWDFLCSAGRRSGEWAKIPVPSNWEQQGFGNYNYGHDDPATKHDETGTYRTQFMVPLAWKDKHVRLVFEGSMTQTSIRINGKPVGFPNYGAYVPFRFNLDKTNIQYGKKNTLEVLVRKKPDNESLDMAERAADYWVFGGIHRPVYLEVQPKEFVHRVAIDARADGAFRMDVFPQVNHPTKFREETKTYIDQVVAQIQTLEGEDVGEPMRAEIRGGAGRVRLATTIARPATWSPERPRLYQVRVRLLKGDEIISEKTERFGFRTFEHRPGDGLYLNGGKLLIQGVNRNTFNPDTARAVNAADEWNEARAIKAMNANLVRSHLPPTPEFSRACDELGLMVITELTNWHDPVIDTPIARNIAYEIVTTYQNHPSVILWANGNENGFNLEIDEVYHLYDLQDRPVIHPWSLFEGIDTLHYPSYETLLMKLKGPNVYLPTEFLHGLYDGGHGSAMEDYWAAIRQSPFGAGGVFWCWKDNAIRRTDLDGKLDTAGNMSADGMVGPYGEKEASYFTVREIWSPVRIDPESLPPGFSGSLPVENRYHETGLDECSFTWRLLGTSDPFSGTAEAAVRAEGSMKGPDIAPGKSGTLDLTLPADWRESGVLELTALSPAGVEIMKWTWPVTPETKASSATTAPVKQSGGNPYEVTVGNAVWSFSPETGRLTGCTVDGKPAGIGNGPVLHAGSLEHALKLPNTWKPSVSTRGDSVVIESKNTSDGSTFKWTVSPDGSAALEYAFAPIGEKLAYCAVGFDLDESGLSAKRWLGDGPHRIWGNRLKGPQFGLWENAYNDHATGVQWGAPEFKGIFGNVEWMRLDMKSGASLLADTDAGTSLGVLRPKNADETRDEKNAIGPVRAWWHYPESGGLFLFHKLPGVGTKFFNARDLGPQSSPSDLPGPIRGHVSFRAGQGPPDSGKGALR